MTLPRGVRKELKLCARATKTARTHLSAARLGLTGAVDAEALELLVALHDVLFGLVTLGRLPRVTKTKEAA